MRDRERERRVHVYTCTVKVESQNGYPMWWVLLCVWYMYTSGERGSERQKGECMCIHVQSNLLMLTL